MLFFHDLGLIYGASLNYLSRKARLKKVKAGLSVFTDTPFQKQEPLDISYRRWIKAVFYLFPNPGLITCSVNHFFLIQLFFMNEQCIRFLIRNFLRFFISHVTGR